MGQLEDFIDGLAQIAKAIDQEQDDGRVHILSKDEKAFYQCTIMYEDAEKDERGFLLKVDASRILGVMNLMTDDAIARIASKAIGEKPVTLRGTLTRMAQILAKRRRIKGVILN